MIYVILKHSRYSASPLRESFVPQSFMLGFRPLLSLAKELERLMGMTLILGH